MAEVESNSKPPALAKESHHRRNYLEAEYGALMEQTKRFVRGE